MTNRLTLAALFVATSATGSAHARGADAHRQDADALQDAVRTEIQGEVVAFDGETSLLKIKARIGGEPAVELSLQVDKEATAPATELKPGEHVNVVCREGTAAEKCLVTGIRKVEPKH